MLTEDQIKKVALDIIETIAPEADIENLDPAVRFATSSISIQSIL